MEHVFPLSRHWLLVIACIVAVVSSFGLLMLKNNPRRAQTTPQLVPTTPVAQQYQALQSDENLAVATFAGGCFWCMEGPFEAEPGVAEVISGYAGGEEVDPTYEAVASGQTEHREAVQIFYNPDEVSFERLLEIYWWQVDPTDPGGQFADRGFQYTTAIFTHSDAEAEIVRQAIANLDASDRYEKPIVTQVLPFTSFYPAEEYHQNFYKKQSRRYEQYKEGSGRGGYIRENAPDLDTK